jgi:capsid protein
MPWIDPLKEAKANLELTQAGFASEVEIIRRRGGNPRDVLEQIAAWREKVKEKGLTLSSDAATDKQAAGPAPANGEQDAE